MYVNKLIEASVQKENGLNEVIVYYYDSWSPFKAVSTYTLFFPSLFLFILYVSYHDVLFEQMGGE